MFDRESMKSTNDYMMIDGIGSVQTTASLSAAMCPGLSPRAETGRNNENRVFLQHSLLINRPQIHLKASRVKDNFRT